MVFYNIVLFFFPLTLPKTNNKVGEICLCSSFHFPLVLQITPSQSPATHFSPDNLAALYSVTECFWTGLYKLPLSCNQALKNLIKNKITRRRIIFWEFLDKRRERWTWNLLFISLFFASNSKKLCQDVRK